MTPDFWSKKGIWELWQRKCIFIALSFHMISDVANIYLEYSACCIDNRYDTLCGVDWHEGG